MSNEPLPVRDHLEVMIQRLIDSIDAMTEQVRLNNDLIAKLGYMTDRLAASNREGYQLRREVYRLQNPEHQNRARKRRNAW